MFCPKCKALTKQVKVDDEKTQCEACKYVLPRSRASGRNRNFAAKRSKQMAEEHYEWPPTVREFIEQIRETVRNNNLNENEVRITVNGARNPNDWQPPVLHFGPVWQWKFIPDGPQGPQDWIVISPLHPAKEKEQAA
jgi:hypothetical protein